MRTIREIGLAAGLDWVGFASADPFPEVATELEYRNATGLSNRLGFTYADPGGHRSPHPSPLGYLTRGRCAVLPPPQLVIDASLPDESPRRLVDRGTSRPARRSGRSPVC